LSDAGMEPGADLGPLVTRDAKKRVEDLIAKGEEEGAELILDGRGIVVPGYENGNFIGPTIIHNVKVYYNVDASLWAVPRKGPPRFPTDGRI